MKVTLTMKCPGHNLSNPEDAAIDLLEEEATEEEIEELAQKIGLATSKFMEYDEYVNIEIDLDTQTATVIPARKMR